MRVHRISIEAEEEKRKRVLKAEQLMIAVIAVTVIVIALNLIQPDILGFVTYPGDAAIWDFSNPAEYSFDSSKILVSSGAQLILQNQTTTWEEEIAGTAILTAAVYDGDNKLSKVNSKDDSWLTVNKNKIFDVTFSHSLNNGDIIRLYLKQVGNHEPDIFICDASASCDSPGYGLVHFDGTEGWYEITLSGLSSPAFTFNIDPDEDGDLVIEGADNKVKVDYIEAQYTETIEHSSTTQVYPSSSVIETDEAVVENFGSWGTFSAVEILSGQSINYFYSSDSGSSWSSLNPGDDLSAVSSNKIKFKAELISDSSATPVLTSLSIGYSTCAESWTCTGWSECSAGGTQTRTCTDSNSCGTENNKPNETQTCEYLCIEEWSCTDWEPEACPENQTQTRICTDLNSCGAELNKPNETQTCEYIPEPTTEESYSTIINSSNSQLEITTSGQINASDIEVVESNTSSVENSVARPANKYVSINADVNDKLKWSIIKMYYTDAEIAGLNESTLSIYYLNETVWQIINSSVNEENNFVWANVTHFSTYGLFGEPLPSEPEEEPQSSPAPNTGGGGSGGGRGSGSHTAEPAAIPESPAPKAPETENILESKQPIREVIQESASRVAGAATRTASNVYDTIGISGIIILFISCFALVVLLEYVRKK